MGATCMAVSMCRIGSWEPGCSMPKNAKAGRRRYNLFYKRPAAGLSYALCAGRYVTARKTATTMLLWLRRGAG
jgi:hypothetical protein